MSRYIRSKFNYKLKCRSLLKKRKRLYHNKLYITCMLDKLWSILPVSNEKAMTPKESVDVIRSDTKVVNIDIYVFCNYYSIKLIKSKKRYIIFNGENIVLYYSCTKDIYQLVGALFLFFLEGNLFSYKLSFKSKYKRSSYRYQEYIDEFGRELYLLIGNKGR